ncbi:MAG: hypothetical protein ACI3Y1_02035 [Candidatus Cryptobacteroides sp.]
MKKFFYLAVAACTALAACSKNEVTPVDVDQQITFQAVVSPSTKALGATQKTFSTDHVFRSWAFHDQTDWSTSSSTAQLYLGGTDGALISYQTDSWKSTTTYYWPKTGKLTFFSYSTDKADCAITGATVNCTNADGITVTNYNLESNNNVDFLVADIAKDQTTNTSTYEHNGVPTLFRHKLSYVIFQIKTANTYAGKTFTLKSIKLNNIAKEGNYTQGAGSTEDWNGTITENKEYLSTDQVFAADLVTPTSTRDYYIPMTFTDSQTIELVYEIKTDNGTSTPATETITVNKKLSELFPNSWKMGKKYTCVITVTLNEILWDPAIEDWEDGSSTPVAIS